MATPVLAPSTHGIIPINLDVLVHPGCVMLVSPSLSQISMETLGIIAAHEVVRTTNIQRAAVLYIEFDPSVNWETGLRKYILDTLWPPSQYQVVLTEGPVPTSTTHPFAVKDINGSHVTLVAPSAAQYTDATIEVIARELRDSWGVRACTTYLQYVGRRPQTGFVIEFAGATWHTPGIQDQVLMTLRCALVSHRVRLVRI